MHEQSNRSIVSPTAVTAYSLGSSQQHGIEQSIVAELLLLRMRAWRTTLRVLGKLCIQSEASLAVLLLHHW